METIIAAVMGAMVSFLLLFLNEFLKDYHLMKSVALGIIAELGEIEKQFCYDLVGQIEDADRNKYFIKTKYSEVYTTVFDNCINSLFVFGEKDSAKLVAVYMRIRDFFDALRTEADAVDLHITKNEMGAAYSAYNMFTELNVRPLLVKAEDLKIAINEVYPILEMYRDMSIFRYLKMKVPKF